ncbi:MAG: glycosyltransferase, partial [Ignavibacteria bacterium]
MKILQLSPQFPFPLTDGGKISIANMTRALVSSSCEVHILCMVHTMPTQEEIQRFEEYSGAQCICIVNNTRNTPLAILKSLFDFHVPLYIRKHRSSAFTDEIDRYLLEHTFDAILCDHTAMAESGIYASKQSGLPCIVRMHNIEYVIWKRYAERLSRLDPRRWYTEKQARVLRTMEIELSKNIHHLAMITQNDVEHIQSLSTHISASYIPVGIDTELFKPNNASATNTRMIHATTYDW